MPGDSKITSTGEGKTYITLQYLSRLVLWIYFRNIKVICKGSIPAEGPLLVAANHSNMVLDPIILIATFPHSRPCHFWALARFFRIPFVGKILKAAGVLPVDTKTHSNAKLFEHTIQALDKGSVVALFPEGTSYTAPNHLPFKDGISWVTFEYLTQLAEKAKNQPQEQPQSISIIPVGITYSIKNRWRSDVIVEYSAPIVKSTYDLEEFYEEPKKSVKNLTEFIAKGVECSTINGPDWDTTNVASAARFILFGKVSLDKYVRVTQSLIAILNNEDNEKKLYIKERFELKERLLLFSNQLKSLRLGPGDINLYENKAITLTRASLRLISAWMSLAIQIPLFLPGLIINSPFYIMGRVIDSYEPYTESVSQDKVVFSVILAVPVYGSLIFVLWKSTGYALSSLCCVLLLLPLFTWYHMALIDKNYDMLKQVIASWRIFIAVLTGTRMKLAHFVMKSDRTESRAALENCVHLRRYCREHLKQLILKLVEEGDSNAIYLMEYDTSLNQSSQNSAK
ncbi:hypothetical protein BDF20DRAFT_912797 [Mycotypha africana]|uniref:uncharacterized protein n=1 Tax=Mycotypha africana TaxID=64632 RepID=UPI0023005087|nr:uncharacterized protein BDF20DRAFT_912797 [Mycotypha africana]KAI8979171.1 hypothetical protein BDF20DRAFT_912797 [Mycotypha africana]